MLPHVIAAALRTARRTLGVRIVYRRGDDEVVIEHAGVGKTSREVQGIDGLVNRVEMRDYLVAAADLVLDGVATLPEAGDEIEEVEPSQRLVAEVRPLGREPAWRYSDPGRTTLRIHTQVIDTSPAADEEPEPDEPEPDDPEPDEPEP